MSDRGCGPTVHTPRADWAILTLPPPPTMGHHTVHIHGADVSLACNPTLQERIEVRRDRNYATQDVFKYIAKERDDMTNIEALAERCAASGLSSFVR